ncbi:MAG TPA: ribonuclease HII [Bacteroidia bacterium]|nr:ribonuclease HII [Bacteroidia bacterium]
MLQKFLNSYGIEAGCDEAGRGCLAGPVVAAAVILPRKMNKALKALDDSKKLNEKQRMLLRPLIEKHAKAFAIGIVSNKEIDSINILNASFLAMHRAIEQLTLEPDLLLIDGNRFNRYKNVKHECIIQGDGKFMSIAAASILAKTYRDELMEKLHAEFPVYDWKKNKAYPTRFHRSMIEKNGISPYHRLSFTLLATQLELSFKSSLSKKIKKKQGKPNKPKLHA